MKDDAQVGEGGAGGKAKRGRAKSKLPKLIEAYYGELAELAHQNVMYEMGTRTAFHNLLAGAGRDQHWTLIAELERKANGKTIRPDGTFKDSMNLVRGYWEAKDPGDNLDAEIAKKRKLGYPLNNIIFEDNLTAVLFQHGAESMRVDMKDPKKLEDLIVQFFRHIEPQIEEFEEAVDEFKEKVPDLAEGLKKKIEQAHKTNAAFKKAFADFFELCKTSLNPNLSEKAVDEMLIQHILTERLIREIFDNPEFVRRNVIAAEVEKVMQAMTSTSFDRNTYLKELDRFYVAIEMAARTMTDFSDKQHFLNTVYERFFQGYSVKLADTMGIVYTPQAIVDFMCASVAEVLEKEFGKKLWSDDVYIIDPCTGTGNFIVNLIRRMPKAKLPDVYKNRLFANEIMLLPYYIAALNIEHAYYEQTGTYEGFEGLCFVDTLDLAEHPQGQLGFMTAKNSERVERQRRSPITVVIGNPPYNVGQYDENDNNKNRKYPELDRVVSRTYADASRATNKNALSDAYVKFIRWGTNRLENRDGILCFVTNNSFVHQPAFDGMRQHLRQDFQMIYHVDLHGNVRNNPKLSGTTHNVFGIQVGVGITIAVRHAKRDSSAVLYHRVPENWTRVEKLEWLAQVGSSGGTEFRSIPPDSLNRWIVPKADAEYRTMIASSVKASAQPSVRSEVIFAFMTGGVKSNRDEVVYDFDPDRLKERVLTFIENYNAEVDRYARSGRPSEVDTFVRYDQIKWSRDLKLDLVRGSYASFVDSKVRDALFRPFSRKFLFLDRILNEEVYSIHRVFPTGRNNVAIVTTSDMQIEFSSLMVNVVPCLHLGGRQGQCVPFYTYDEDGSNRKENVTDWCLKEFREHYKDQKIDKWSIFYYVYGVLHHAGYREKFADNLKRELPRVPYAGDFRAFSEAGKKLAGLHLDYEKLEPWELEWVETPGVPLSYRVEDKMRLNKEKTKLVVNPSLALAGIPPVAFEYRLGNRSALEWVVDQYQVCTDARSGIASDPNREDDPQYIVRLVGQVVRVSVETVGIVKGLPVEFSSKSP
ncbi:MAG TPA: type ISP restriction/modification enzyme [Tepidisphaeraceae bacterium]|jgi:predicted helicase